MFDARIRPLIDPPLNKLAKLIAQRGIGATQITLSGFILGVIAFILICQQAYGAAAIFVLLNRLLDGLDGAVARQHQVTIVGAYLDITLDFIFYSLFILGFAIAKESNALAAALLIFSFVASGTAFLAHGIFSEKLNLSSVSQGRKSFYYLAGLAEGFETIVSFLLMCIFPEHFVLIAVTFSIICLISTAARMATSIKLFQL